LEKQILTNFASIAKTIFLPFSRFQEVRDLGFLNYLRLGSGDQHVKTINRWSRNQDRKNDHKGVVRRLIVVEKYAKHGVFERTLTIEDQLLR
jgi:hypothetical protein